MTSKYSFEWDEAKNLINLKKHGVSFCEAQQVFLDKNRILAQDLEHTAMMSSAITVLAK